jgi:hypothetical protein
MARSSEPAAPRDTVAVHIEPLPGVSAQRLDRALKAANVTNIKERVPGMLTGQMPEANLDALQSVAGVEIMHRKSPR